MAFLAGNYKQNDSQSNDRWNFPNIWYYSLSFRNNNPTRKQQKLSVDDIKMKIEKDSPVISKTYRYLTICNKNITTRNVWNTEHWNRPLSEPRSRWTLGTWVVQPLKLGPLGPLKFDQVHWLIALVGLKLVELGLFELAAYLARLRFN